MEDVIVIKKKVQGGPPKKMTIRRQVIEGKTVHAEIDEDDIESGSITDIQLLGAGKSEPIKFLQDDVIIETGASPGCTWYFFGGRWWRICV